MSSKKAKKAATSGMVGRTTSLVHRKPAHSVKDLSALLGNVASLSKNRRRIVILDAKTGTVLKSLTIEKPLLPLKEKSKKTARARKAARKGSLSGQHIVRAATVDEMRAHLGIKGKDVVRAHQLMLRLKS